MLCQRCKSREASVHLTKIANGKKTEIYLCEECARQTGQLAYSSGDPFSFQNLLAGMLGTGVKSYEGYQNDICESCGLNYNEFTEKGLFGCAGCYDSFSERLDPLLKRIHGSNRHNGKVPKKNGGNLRVKKEIKALRKRLQEAVQTEEFEKAAELRDKIRELEDNIGGEQIGT